tara:strand:+ start:720 stop:932 length:213 start_codon:yes stop_codon:yes gene_type:complete
MKTKYKIKSALESEGLTFRHLAKEMNIANCTLSNRLSSQSMTVANAIKLSDALFALTQTQLTLDDFRKDQ